MVGKEWIFFFPSILEAAPSGTSHLSAVMTQALKKAIGHRQ